LPPGAFDVVQVVLVISALLADAVALWAIAGRITELGFSPNGVAALGENVILLVNLAWSAVLYIRFLGGRGIRSPPSKNGRRITCRSTACGQRWSRSSFRRYSDTSDNPHTHPQAERLL
jgi:hypothetical protein